MKRKSLSKVLLFTFSIVLMFPTPVSFAADPTPAPTPSPTNTAVPTPTPSATGSGAPSPSPSASTTFPHLPPLILPSSTDRALPGNLRPSLAGAILDRPKPYPDRCHTGQNLIESTAPCLYGDQTGLKSIVLFGDSHALSWFPAVNLLAKAKKWRLYSLTMSSCWPAKIPAWNNVTRSLMTNCAIWRANTLKRIEKLHPLMVFVSGTRGFSTISAEKVELKGDQRVQVWQVGMKNTIDRLKLATPRVILISDTPSSNFNPAECLAIHKRSVMACSTPIAEAISTTWIAIEKQIAADEMISWVDPTLWICSATPCQPIVGNTLIYVDGGHLTATFGITLEKPLWKEISSQ